jgi:hypothetical protein
MKLNISINGEPLSKENIAIFEEALDSLEEDLKRKPLKNIVEELPFQLPDEFMEQLGPMTNFEGLRKAVENVLESPKAQEIMEETQRELADEEYYDDERDEEVEEWCDDDILGQEEDDEVPEEMIDAANDGEWEFEQPPYTEEAQEVLDSLHDWATTNEKDKKLQAVLLLRSKSDGKLDLLLGDKKDLIPTLEEVLSELKQQ